MPSLEDIKKSMLKNGKVNEDLLARLQRCLVLRYDLVETRTHKKIENLPFF